MRLVPYTPQENGVAKRKNRTLKDMMNAMLVSSGLPDNMYVGGGCLDCLLYT